MCVCVCRSSYCICKTASGKWTVYESVCVCFDHWYGDLINNIIGCKDEKICYY